MIRTNLFVRVITVVILCGFVVIPEIYAQTPTAIPAKYEYAVKFVCGQGDDKQTVKGVYLTAINVHNPGTMPRDSVTFAKKVVLTLPGEKSGFVSKFKIATLKPNRGLEIECNDIKSFIIAPSPPPAFYTGFLVILSPKPLDVVAVYTARNSNSEVESIDVDTIQPRAVNVVIIP